MAVTEQQLHDLRTTLAKYVPQVAVERISTYIVERHVHMRITQARSTKYGDYRMPSLDRPYHSISVNGNLTPEFFMHVLLHEMAHLETFLSNGRSVKPHGIEWQSHYRQLMIAYADCYPAEAQPLLSKYSSKLPLSPSVGSQLDALLRTYGMPPEQPAEATQQAYTMLDDLHPMDTFVIADGHHSMMFQVVEHKRTRWICRDVHTDRLYSVKGTTSVIPLKMS